MLSIIRRNVRLFSQYSGAGMTGFAFDLVFLWLFLHVFNMYYLLATVLAFGIGTSCHFLIARRYVFTNALRSFRASYGYFLVIASVGISLVTSLMYLQVGVLGFETIPARIGAATLVGFVSFALHKKLSFMQQETNV